MQQLLEKLLRRSLKPGSEFRAFPEVRVAIGVGQGHRLIQRHSMASTKKNVERQPVKPTHWRTDRVPLFGTVLFSLKWHN